MDSQQNNMNVDGSQPLTSPSQTPTTVMPSADANIHGSAAVQTAVPASDPSVTGPAAKVQKVALKTPAAKAKAKFESEDKWAMIAQRVSALEQAYEQLAGKVEAGGRITGQLDVFAA